MHEKWSPDEQFKSSLERRPGPILSYFQIKSRTYRSAATRTAATVPERLTLSRGRPMFQRMGAVVPATGPFHPLNPTGITNEGTICRAPLKFRAMQMKVFGPATDATATPDKRSRFMLRFGRVTADRRNLAFA